MLAGGQSLVPLLSMRLAAPGTLVDINGLPEPGRRPVSDDGVRVGALARHADVLASADVRRVQPLVALALANVAHPTIRNRGTTVGSIVHADAAAEMPVVLRLLGGSVDVESAARAAARSRPTTCSLGPLESSLAPRRDRGRGVLPGAARPARGVAFEEIARRHGDYALCGVAALVRTATGHLGAGRLPLGERRARPSSTCPTLADGVTDASLAAAGDAALAELDPADDIHATADYRAHLVAGADRAGRPGGVRRREGRRTA